MQPLQSEGRAWQLLQVQETGISCMSYLEGCEVGMMSVAPRLLVPPSTLPGLLSSSNAMLASLPAAPSANLQRSACVLVC